MIHIDASQLDHRRLNEQIRHSPGTLRITGCLGQRFIGAGAEQGRLEITGTPGNALGAYLDGACIEVRGNAQDAVGDTMNDGRIIVHGSIGDAAGYAMRLPLSGGEVFFPQPVPSMEADYMKYSALCALLFGKDGNQ